MARAAMLAFLKLTKAQNLSCSTRMLSISPYLPDKVSNFNHDSLCQIEETCAFLETQAQVYFEVLVILRECSSSQKFGRSKYFTGLGGVIRFKKVPQVFLTQLSCHVSYPQGWTGAPEEEIISMNISIYKTFFETSPKTKRLRSSYVDKRDQS